MAPTALAGNMEETHEAMYELVLRCGCTRPDRDRGLERVFGLLPWTLVSIVKHWNRHCGNVHRRIPCK